MSSCMSGLGWGIIYAILWWTITIIGLSLAPKGYTLFLVLGLIAWIVIGGWYGIKILVYLAKDDEK